MKRCGIEDRFKTPAGLRDSAVITDYAFNNILLCPTVKQVDAASDYDNVHASVGASADGAFAVQIQICNPIYATIPFEQLELWQTTNEAEEELARWEDVTRVAELCGSQVEEWETEPHFVLKWLRRDVVKIIKSWSDFCTDETFEYHTLYRVLDG